MIIFPRRRRPRGDVVAIAKYLQGGMGSVVYNSPAPSVPSTVALQADFSDPNNTEAWVFW